MHVTRRCATPACRLPEKGFVRVSAQISESDMIDSPMFSDLAGSDDMYRTAKYLTNRLFGDSRSVQEYSHSQDLSVAASSEVILFGSQLGSYLGRKIPEITLPCKTPHSSVCDG